MEKQTFVLDSVDKVRAAFVEIYRRVLEVVGLGERVVIEIKGDNRTSAQNRHMWLCLADISAQVDWYGHKLTPDEWKNILSSAITKQKVVPGIDIGDGRGGGFVMCGAGTSKMSKKQFSEMQELIFSFGAQQGVKFSVDRFDDVMNN